MEGAQDLFHRHHVRDDDPRPGHQHRLLPVHVSDPHDQQLPGADPPLHCRSGHGVLHAAVHAVLFASGAAGLGPDRRLRGIQHLQPHRAAHHEAGHGHPGHLLLRLQLEQPLPAHHPADGQQ